MKRILFDYLTSREAEYLSKQVETLILENGYCKDLDLFDGEPYWVKGVDVDGKNSKYNLDMILKIEVKNGKTMIDNRSLESLCDEFNLLLSKPIEKFTDLDRWNYTQYICLTMLNLKLIQNKEIKFTEKRTEKTVKANSYKYNPNKPVIIDNVVYGKNEPKGRKYEKQADTWVVRAHYRFRNGVKYLVKSYTKTFKNILTK